MIESRNHYKYVFLDEEGEETTESLAVRAVEILSYPDNDGCIDFEESPVDYIKVGGKWQLENI